MSALRPVQGMSAFRPVRSMSGLRYGRIVSGLQVVGGLLVFFLLLRPDWLPRWVYWGVLALGAATFVFTWCPPDGLLFRDLSLPAFYSLPC